jgi:hypothetical protein
MEEVEDTVSLEREMTTDSEVAETTIHWVPDVGHTRGRDTVIGGLLNYTGTSRPLWGKCSKQGKMLKILFNFSSMVFI